MPHPREAGHFARGVARPGTWPVSTAVRLAQRARPTRCACAHRSCVRAPAADGLVGARKGREATSLEAVRGPSGRGDRV
eukprot:256854-Prymnesium_polylepis.2